VRDGESSGGWYLNHLQSYPTAIHGWFNSKPPELVKTLNWCSPSPLVPFPLYFAVKMVTFDCREVPVGHKGCQGKGTGRGKVCAGSCDLESTVAVSVAGIITRDDMVEGDFPLILNL